MPPLGPRGKVRKVVRRSPPPRSEVAAAGGVGRPKVKPMYGPSVKESSNYPAQVRKVRRKQFQQVYGAKPVNRYEAQIQQGKVAGPSVSESASVVRAGQHAHQAVQQAHAGKPFNAVHLRSAIASGIAPGIRESKGVFYLKHHRTLGSDYEVPVRPSIGYDEVTAQTQGTLGAARAPVLKVLEQTTRPVHGIAGAASAALEGKNVGHAFTQGLVQNKPYSFSRVLKDLGAPKVVQKAGGFTGDVLLDPTTYVTFGAGSIARKAAQDAAEQTAKRYAALAARESAAAVRRGATEAQAKATGDRVILEGEQQAKKAAQRASAAAKPGKGLTASFAGKQVPGVTSATAAGGRVVKRVAAKAPAPVKATGSAVRGVVSDVRPSLAPVGADEAQFKGVRAAARGVRSYTNHQLAVIDSHVRGLAKQIGPDNHAAVIDAIERRKINSLPEELRRPAIFLRSQFRHANKLRRQAGLGEGKIHDYFPHAQAQPLEAGQGIQQEAPKGARSGRIVRAPSSSEQRTLRVPISEANPILAAEDRGQFSTNPALVYGNYQRESLRNVLAPAELAKRLTSAGRPIKPGKPFELQPGERVYRLGFESPGSTSHVVGQTKKGGDVFVKHPAGKGRFGLRPLSQAEERALASPNTRHSGQYVALHEQTVTDAAAQATPMQATTSIGRGIDKTTRAFKALATATPGFHARNAVGDVQMGYLSQPGHRLPVNLYQAGKAVRGLHAQQKAAENLAHDTATTGKTIKVAGARMKVEDFLKLARDHGVVQSGYLTRELADLGAKGERGIKQIGKVRSAGRKAGRVLTQNPASRALLQDRENVVRLATFKHGLDTGLPAEQAASLSLGTHIDYGDLTHFERKYARRLMPFYTFTARALPLHVNRLLTRPGKFANIEKAREQIGGTDVSGYPSYVQRQVPFNVGKTGVTDALPVSILNEVPTTTSVSKYVDEIGQFTAGLANPILKTFPELYANKSFTFRNALQDPQHPYVSAPSWVAALPADVRKQLGVVQGPDSRTGKTVWKWHGKTDYAIRQVALGPFNAISQIATAGTGRTGQNQTQKAVAAVTGVRVTPQDKITQQINGLYDEINALAEKQAGLGQQINPANKQKISAKNPTPEFDKVKAQIHAKEVQIYNLAKKRHDKVLPKRGAPRRPRSGGDVGGGFGGFGSGFGGGFK